MGYDYTLPEYYVVKETKRYPWPCDNQPDRTIEVYPEDILTKKSNNRYNMQTGIYKMGIHIPDEDVVFHPEACHLRLL